MIPKIIIWEICVINKLFRGFAEQLHEHFTQVFFFFLCFYSTTTLLNYRCIDYFYGIAEQLYEQSTQFFLVGKTTIYYGEFTDGRIDFRFVAAQLYA